jgi:hypothetical protein
MIYCDTSDKRVFCLGEQSFSFCLERTHLGRWGCTVEKESKGGKEGRKKGGREGREKEKEVFRADLGPSDLEWGIRSKPRWAGSGQPHRTCW